jgi:Domain of unknown function (DUF4157)
MISAHKSGSSKSSSVSLLSYTQTRKPFVLSPLFATLPVKEPERIRVRLVPEIQLPEEEDLRLTARALGLDGFAEALTLGYGILLHQDRRNDDRVIAHELVHVARSRGSAVSSIS